MPSKKENRLPKLKRCPYCNGVVEFYELTTSNVLGWLVYFSCTKCKKTTIIISHACEEYIAKKEAFKAINERHKPKKKMK